MDQPTPKIDVQATIKEIAKFQFVLDEGRKGNHLLFAPDAIRGAFAKDQAALAKVFEEKLEEVNAALNQTFLLSTFEEKRSFLSQLPPEVRDAMIFGYFQLLDGLESATQERSVH